MKKITMSVTFKVVVPVVILLVLAISGQSLYTSIRSVDDLRDSLEQQVGWISSYAGVYYTRLIDSSLATTQVLHGLAQTYMERGAPREELFGAIRSPLYDQESIVGAWIAFEPNAYDGLDAEFAGVAPFNQDGNFASYWYRAGGEVGSMGLDQYRGEPFYSVPLSNGRPYLSEPYEYEAGEEVLAMITVSMPVRSGGRTVGVVGVDIDLSASQSRIETIQPLGTGYAFIVTGSGAVAAHPNRAILMTQAAQYFQNPGDFSHAVEAHEEYRETKVAVGGQQEESLFVVSPFDMPALGETWFVGVSVPTTVMREAERKSAIAAVTGAATAIVVALLVLIPVLARITRPIRESAAAIQSISEGAGDLTQRMKVTTRDEVGRLAGSFNRFIDYQNTFIGSLKQNADRTGDAKNEVVSSAEETSASVRQIGANVQSIARQVETLDTTVTGSAAALEQNAAVETLMQGRSQAEQALVRMAVRERALELLTRLELLEVIAEQARSESDWRDLKLDESRTLYELEAKADLGFSMSQQTKARRDEQEIAFCQALTRAELDALRGLEP
ncbi:MAG: HAMP domain-containing protein [Spirochaetota bacterium]